MKKTLVMMSMVAALCAACDDNDDVKKSSNWSAPNCSEYERACDGTDLKVCVDGRWQKQTCVSGVCSEGRCVVTACDSTKNKPVAASDAEKVANGLSVDAPAIKICENGSWAVIACDRNQVVGESNGAAVCTNNTSECTVSGAKRCSTAGVPQVCSNGIWADANACEANSVCRAGSCVVERECVDNLIECDDEDPAMVKTCVDGKWEATQCTGGMECRATVDGGCADVSDLPKKGDKCDEKTTDDVCKYGTWYVCENNEIEEYDCTGSRTCVTVPETAGTYFAKPGGQSCMYTNEALGGFCTYEGQVMEDAFSNPCNQGYLYHLKCINIDGKFYAGQDVSKNVCVSNEKIATCSGKTLQYSACEDTCQSTDAVYNTTPGASTCKMGSDAEVGDACNISSFTAYCKDSKTAVSCPNGTIYSRTCPSGTVCSDGLCITDWSTGNGGGNGGNGGGSSSTASCPAGYDDCDESGCEFSSSGEACSDYCKAQNGNACCVNFDTNDLMCNVGGNGGNGGGSSSGATCDVYDCSDEVLATCKQYFPDTVKAVCNAERPFCVKPGTASCDAGEDSYNYFYQDDNGRSQEDALGCLVTGSSESCLTGGSSSGGGSSSASCDVYDCSSEYLELCKGTFPNTEIALCDANRPYCMKSASASCGTGKSGYAQFYIDDNDVSQVSDPFCLAVGNNQSCLSGGSSSGGSSSGDDDLTVCTSSNSQADCQSTWPGSTAICEGNSYMCGIACTKEGATGTGCDDVKGDGVYYAFPTVCEAVGDGLYALNSAQSMSQMTKCTNGCNAAHTACK